MIIQLHHDKIRTKKRDMPNDISGHKDWKLVTKPIDEIGGGLYVKHLIIRREITFSRNISGSGAEFDLFKVPDGFKIVAFRLSPTIRYLALGKLRPTGSKFNVGYVQSVLKTTIKCLEKKTLIRWITPKGTEFGYKDDVIEVIVDVYVTDKGTETLRETMAK